MSIGQSVGAALASLACMIVSGAVLLATPRIGTELTQLACYVVAMGGSLWPAAWIRGLPVAPDSFDLRLPALRSSPLFVLGGVALWLGRVGPPVSLIRMSEADREWFTERLQEGRLELTSGALAS